MSTADANRPTYDTTPAAPAEVSGSTPPQPRRRRWVLPVSVTTAFLVGIAAGGASGETGITAAEQASLTADLETAEQRADEAEADADAKVAELTKDRGEVEARAAELDARQAELDAREAAISGAEQEAASRQIRNGTWTIGVDIEAGTYRTSEEVTSTCYWAILRSGTNGADIVENDLPEGGFPTVVLQDGQDFDNSCGTWDKQ